VPPAGFAVSVTDCPLEIVGELGVTAPATRARFTVTRSVTDTAPAEGIALSVTL
jgi:hypothetical protein